MHYVNAKDPYREALIIANDLLRSAKAIAERKGAETNWEAFIAKLDAALVQQQSLLHPPIKFTITTATQEGGDE